MRFSVSLEYALHGLMYLALPRKSRMVLIGVISRAIGVPESYLRKVFQQLVRHKIVASQRGARGGFYLARTPEEITLKDVVEAIDGSCPAYSCLGLERVCRVSEKCPVHEVFEEAKKKMEETLDNTSLRDITQKLESNREKAAWLPVTV